MPGECDGLVNKLKEIPDLDITLAQASIAGKECYW